MIVEFFGPFDKLAEKRVEILLDAPIRTEAVLRMLADRYPDLAPYCRFENDALLNAHITVICKGMPLKLSDTINDDDTISILLPVTGG